MILCRTLQGHSWIPWEWPKRTHAITQPNYPVQGLSSSTQIHGWWPTPELISPVLTWRCLTLHTVRTTMLAAAEYYDTDDSDLPKSGINHRLCVNVHWSIQKWRAHWSHAIMGQYKKSICMTLLLRRIFMCHLFLKGGHAGFFWSENRLYISFCFCLNAF